MRKSWLNGALAGAMVLLMVLPTLGTLAIQSCEPSATACHEAAMCMRTADHGHACCCHMKAQAKVAILSLLQAVPAPARAVRQPLPAARDRAAAWDATARAGFAFPPYHPPRSTSALS